LNNSLTAPISPKSYPRTEGDGLGADGSLREMLPAEEADPEADVDAEDAQPQQSLRTPELPSRAMIEEHRIDHWPPRSWCDECNEGQGRERRHGKVAESHRVAIVSMDYAFVTRKGQVVSQGEEGWDDEEALKLLVVKDSMSRSVFAHAVPQKGIDEKNYAVDTVVSDVMWLGYNKVLLKSDNEPAMVKVLKEVITRLKVLGVDQVGEEHSPPYDSQANGSVENAVKQVKARMRTLKLCLERRIGKRIPPKHPVMTWMAPHAAAILRYRCRGDDGKTPYERIRLRPFNTRLVGFCEKVSYKNKTKEPTEDEHVWHHGLFLGICPLTGQYVLFDIDKKKIRMARTVKPMPDEAKWDAANVEAVRMSPYDEHTARAQDVIFQDRPVQPGDGDLPRRRAVRKIYIKGEDIKAFGLTRGCQKCDHELRYGPGRTTKGHSDACRQRIVECLSGTEEGLRRLAAADERANHYIDEIHEPHVHGGAEAPPAEVDIGASIRFEDLDDAELRVDAPSPVPARDDERQAPTPPASPMQAEQPDMEMDIVEQPAATVYPEVGVTQRRNDDCREERVRAPLPQRGTMPGGRVEGGSRPSDDDVDDIPLDKMIGLLDQATRDEARELDAEIMQIIGSLGGNGSKYRRERGRAMNAVLSEIYSPPRVSAVAKLCPSFGILPGFALDLTTHDDDGKTWDFDNDEMRARAWKKLTTEQPLLLIGSPMCTAFSAWQYINNSKRDPAVVAKEYARGLRHLTFCCEMYEYQVSQGRYFLHEHPAQATSWQTQIVKRIMDLEGVARTVGHQCQYGAESDGHPIKKPTGFMSNCAGIRKALSKTCLGRKGNCSRIAGGQHILCNGRVARMAAIFPVRLCKAILGGLRDQLRADGAVHDGVVGIHEHERHVSNDADVSSPASCRVEPGVVTDPSCGEDKYAIVDGHLLKFDDGQGPFFDDLTRQQLPSLLVKAARKKELEYFQSKCVWKRVPISESHRVMGRPPVTVRWVDVNKGDDENPEIRSRLVARQIRGANEDPMFAPTPPLESLRTVLSYCATDMEGEAPKCRDGKSPNRVQISLIDISRAYFNAKCDPANPVYVSLPAEDPSYQDTCGLLLKHMYGTQAAADGWQQEYSSTMIKMGFTQGVACPCVFHHKERALVCSVHGDDFTTAGAKPDLDWFETELEARYELRKGGRIGPGKDDEKEGRVLNRVVRWTDAGLEYEADPRQAERLIEAAGLDDSCKSTVTPGLKVTKEQIEAEVALEADEHTPYRGNGARGNYLGPDRPDIQYCSKEICRWMSAPTNLGQDALKRLCRYLLGRKRLVFKYPWQSTGTLECYSDTDWAGCPKTRKSTSGGCLMLGAHLLKSWSSTQPSISLSSGEAEYYGVVKAAGIALGQQSLMSDMGMKVKVRVWTDSSAALGICGRSGLGKLRHVQTHTLWVQERVRSGAIELRKVNGLVNPADLFTKHLSSRERINELVGLFSCEFREGRSLAAPELRKQKTTASAQLCKHSNCHVAQMEPAAGRDDDVNNQSPMHDPAVLPHMYLPNDIEEFFEKAVAPDELDCAPTGACICSRPECKVCFPPPAPEFGPAVVNAEAWIVAG